MDDGPLPTDLPAYAGEWECMECGYIEAGAETRRPKACPACGAPGQALEFFAYEDEEGAGWATPDDFADPDDIFEDADGAAEGLDPEEDDQKRA